MLKDNVNEKEELAALLLKSKKLSRIMGFIATTLLLAGVSALIIIENNTITENRKLVEVNKQLQYAYLHKNDSTRRSQWANKNAPSSQRLQDLSGSAYSKILKDNKTEAKIGDIDSISSLREGVFANVSPTAARDSVYSLYSNLLSRYIDLERTNAELSDSLSSLERKISELQSSGKRSNILDSAGRNSIPKSQNIMVLGKDGKLHTLWEYAILFKDRRDYERYFKQVKNYGNVDGGNVLLVEPIRH
jgi:hypothetical protein